MRHRVGAVGLLAGALALWALAGCGGDGGGGSKDGPPAKPFEGVKLVVGVVGDPALLPSIKSQRGEWSARTGAELVVLDRPVDPAAVRDVDVIVYPGDRMGDLVASGGLAPLPDSVIKPPEAPAPEGTEATPEAPPDPLAYQEVVLAYRDQVARYGPDRMGLPIGGSALVLAYRRAAFDDRSAREAAKAAGLALEPPATWEQFDALAQFFHGRARPGVALAFGADPEGIGDAIFLARAATLAWHRDQFSFLLDSETTEPRVASPPFVEALQSLVALKSFAPPGAEKFDAEAARKAFRDGDAALLIDLAERAGTWGSEGADIGVAPLPGSPRVFDPSRKAWEDVKPPNRPSYLPSGGGWLVGVASATTRKAAAEDFVKYLAGPDSTNRLRAERGFPMLGVRSPQLAQGLTNPRGAPGVEVRPWADAVSKTLNADKVSPGLRIPDAAGYLADLTRARVAAIGGEPPQAALSGLAKAWAERTARLGPPRQTWHHRRSLNGPSTSARPPK